MEKMPNGLIIERTGKAPLKIMQCNRIGKYSSGNRDKTRWYDAELFQTPSGKYVCMIHALTKWEGESDYVVAEPCEDGRALAAWLESLTPWAWFPGYPPGTQFEEKRKRLEADLKGQFARLVTEILADAPDSAIEIA